MKSNNHNNTLNSIKNALKNVEKDIGIQIALFHEKRSSKKYTGIRRDKGYNKWKQEVFDRFNNTCCVCLSDKKIICHHLYSYKYYPDLRTDPNNGVCICNSCHQLFNTYYSNINTLEQFLEFNRIMKNTKIRNYVKKALKCLATEGFIADLKNCGEKFKLIEFDFLKIIIISDDEIYCGIN